MDRTIDFDARVEDGVIRIPSEYSSEMKSGDRVHVTLSSGKRMTRLVKRMIENPFPPPPDFKPLSRDEIYDRGL